MDPRGLPRHAISREEVLRAIALALILTLPLFASLLSPSGSSWSVLDPNLIYTRSGPSSVAVNSTGMSLFAQSSLSPASADVATIAGATRANLSAAFRSVGGFAGTLTVAFESPYDKSAVQLVLDSATTSAILRNLDSTGSVVRSQTLMTFSPAAPIGITAFFAPAQPFQFNITQNARNQLVSDSFPVLANTTPVTLNLGLTTPTKPSEVTITSLTFFLVPDSNVAYVVFSPLLYVEYGLVATLSLLSFRTWFRSLIPHARRFFGSVLRPYLALGPATRYLVLTTAIAIPIQVALMTIGSQPYDIFTEELWAYVGAHYGLTNVLPISLLVPGGISTGSPSGIGSGFPYPPLPLYLFGVVGFAGRVLDPSVGLPSAAYAYGLKAVWLLFLYGIGLVVFWELRNRSHSWPLGLAGFLAIILNPGLLLGSVVWGAFDIGVAFFVLLSVICLLRSRWTWSLIFLLLAVLSKQTALLAAFPIVLIMLARVGIPRFLRSFSSSLVAMFFALLPLLGLGLSPAYILNVTSGGIAFNALSPAAAGIAPWQKIVSSSDFNIWPLLTKFTRNQMGWARFRFPDYLPNQIAGLPYVEFGALLAAIGAALFLLGLWLGQRKGLSESFCLLLFLITFLWFYEVLTRQAGRYLGLVLPVTLLLWTVPQARRLGVCLTSLLSADLTLTLWATLSLTAVETPIRTLAILRPQASFFASDSFITALAVLQLGLLGLAWFAFVWSYRREPKRPVPLVDDLRQSSKIPAAAKVSVILLNFNGGGLGRRCLETVLGTPYPSLEVIVVDNASEDDSVARMAELLSDPRVRYVPNRTNLGYSVANNLGSRLASGDLLLFLNNDTEVAPATIQTMALRFESDPSLGAAQPLLVYLPDRQRINSAGNLVDRLGFHEILQQGEPIAGAKIQRETFYAMGAVLMIRRDVFDRIGGFETLLWSYFTDSDLSWKTWLAGFRVEVIPEAVAFHREGASGSRIDRSERLYHVIFGQLVTVSKNYQPSRSSRVALALVTLDLFLVGMHIALGRRHEARSIIRALSTFTVSIPRIRRAREGIARFRVVSDETLIAHRLRPFNPVQVFLAKRRGWGYPSDYPQSRF